MNRIDWSKYVTKPSHTTVASEAAVTELCHTTVRTCSECKQPLPDDSKAGTRTCSPKCRKRRDRRQAEQHTAWNHALGELQKIRDALKRNEDVQYQQQALLRLREEIMDLLVLAKDQDAMSRMSMLEARARRHIGG